MRIAFIACGVMAREVSFACARSKKACVPFFLPQGLHSLEAGDMLGMIQGEIDRASVPFDAVCLAYGLCSNGTVGLRARTVPVVLPRAHDCITLFLGSRRRYDDYISRHPGSYFVTTGWKEHDARDPTLPRGESEKMGLRMSFDELVRRYGEENARYVAEEMRGGLRHYDRFAFIKMGLGPEEKYIKETRREAKKREWKVSLLKGSMRLFNLMASGRWPDADFLVLQPGEEVKAVYSGGVVEAAPADK